MRFLVFLPQIQFDYYYKYYKYYFYYYMRTQCGILEVLVTSSVSKNILEWTRFLESKSLQVNLFTITIYCNDKQGHSKKIIFRISFVLKFLCSDLMATAVDIPHSILMHEWISVPIALNQKNFVVSSLSMKI